MFGARLVCVALLIGLPAVVACAGDEARTTLSTAPSATDSGPAPSELPSMNVDEKPDNVSLLLTEAEVRSIDGLSEVVAQELAGAPLSENPDPRGPCGAAVPQSPTAGAAGRTFAGSGLTIVQKIVETGVEQHTFLVSLQSDEHIGCAPYRSTTSAGQSQSVSEITFLEQAANNGPGIAWTARADVPGGTGYFGSSVVEVNGRSSFVSIFSLTPIHTATLAALVQLAADKLSA